jgi:hypothetical protein
LLAEAHAQLGQPVEGLNCLAEATQIIEATEERCNESELHGLRGDLLNATGHPFEVERSYHQALAVARLQNAKFLELRAGVSLARLWRDQGKRTEARDFLAPIYGWFTEGWTRRSCKTPKRCSTSWGDTLSPLSRSACGPIRNDAAAWGSIS